MFECERAHVLINFEFLKINYINHRIESKYVFEINATSSLMI